MFRLSLNKKSGAEGEGVVVQEAMVEDLKPATHTVNVLSMRELRGEPVEAGEILEPQNCPGSDFDLVEVEHDPTPDGPVRGACFVCGKGFTRKQRGYPVEPTDGLIERITATILAEKIAP